VSAQVRNPHNKRWKLWKAQGGECPLCLRSIRWNAQIADEQPTLDHIIPKKIGGGNEITNLRVVHALCNARRGHSLTAMPWADTPAVIAAAFLSEPVAPPVRRVAAPASSPAPRPAPRPVAGRGVGGACPVRGRRVRGGGGRG